MPYVRDPAKKAAADRRYREKNRGKVLARKRAYRLENLEKRRAANAQYYAKNTATVNAANQNWKRTNKGRHLAGNKKWQQANAERVRAARERWEQANPGHKNYRTALRRGAKALAVPVWLTPEQLRLIAVFYKLAAATGQHVDHVIPLRGRNVCGLHVPWNLQLLSPEENNRKGNRLLEAA